jgi:hypothetical protein
MTKYVKGRFTFLAPSRRKWKKYDVFDTKTDKYITSFGDKRYEQYKDKIGYYSKLDHNDKQRKKNYYSRHGKATPLSAKFFSHRFLW